MNFCASSHDTESTGSDGPLLTLGLSPMIAVHCSWVTSYLPKANGLSVTLRCGCSSLLILSSGLAVCLAEPMIKLPPGSLTISGQSAQSLNTVPAFCAQAGAQNSNEHTVKSHCRAVMFAPWFPWRHSSL